MSKGIQRNSNAYFWFPPTGKGWVQPDAGWIVNGGVEIAYDTRPMLPQPFPVGNRARGTQTAGVLNGEAGGDNVLLVPPDRFWRKRTSPRTPKDTRLGRREVTKRPQWGGFTFPLSFGG